MFFRDFDFENAELKAMVTNPKTGELVKEGETYTRPELANTLGKLIIKNIQPRLTGLS